MFNGICSLPIIPSPYPLHQGYDELLHVFDPGSYVTFGGTRRYDYTDAKKS